MRVLRDIGDLATFTILTAVAIVLFLLPAYAQEGTLTVTTGKDATVHTICVDQVCVSPAFVKRWGAGFKDGEKSSYAERMQDGAIRVAIDLRDARAAHAACQTTLGSVEPSVRNAEIQHDVDTQRADYELSHPGWTLGSDNKPEPAK